MPDEGREAGPGHVITRSTEEVLRVAASLKSARFELYESDAPEAAPEEPGSGAGE